MSVGENIEETIRKIGEVWIELTEKEKEEISEKLDRTVINRLQEMGYQVYDSYGAKLVISQHYIDATELVVDTVVEELRKLGKWRC